MTNESRLREAVDRLLAAIDELNTAKPLVQQAAWTRVVLWADICKESKSVSNGN